MRGSKNVNIVEENIFIIQNGNATVVDHPGKNLITNGLLAPSTLQLGNTSCCEPYDNPSISLSITIFLESIIIDFCLLAKYLIANIEYKLTNMIISYGIATKASDIHIENDPTGTHIRYRVDGIIRELK
ncbi:MAG: hypothetical protein IIB41_06645, partial [Candidatus Marinimicrobia bacterium]|nr:hypothetical protein [Candidatus Neomarinimicrobiota bacterium]